MCKEKRNPCKVLTWNIKMNLNESGRPKIDQIYLAVDRD
jgi:hypothetical protein